MVIVKVPGATPACRWGAAETCGSGSRPPDLRQSPQLKGPARLRLCGMPRTVLVVDDSAAFRATARMLLTGARLRGRRRRPRTWRPALAAAARAAAGLRAAGRQPARRRRRDAPARCVRRRVSCSSPRSTLGARRRRRALRRARVRAQGRARIAAAGRTARAAMSDRVVIAEDQALLRQGIVRLLADAGFEVVAEAADAPDLLRKVAAHKPDVAIVDVQMPPDNTDDGLRAAMQIRATQPDVGVLVLSPVRRGALRGRPDRRQRRGRRLPAQGPRDRLQRRSPTPSGASAAGGSVLDPTVVAHMLGRRRRDDPLDALTPREREVLEYDGRGPLEQGHRRGARRHPARRREARDEHLQQARRGRRRRGPPARARRARVPRDCRHVSGISAARGRACPRPRGLSTSSVPSSAPTRSPRPRRPVPAGRVRAADAVVAHVDHRVAVLAPHARPARASRRRTWRRWSAPRRRRSRPRSRPRSGAVPPARSRARPAPARGWPATPARRRARAGRAPRDGCRRRGRAARRPPPGRWRTRCRRARARPPDRSSKRSRASWSSIISATSRCCAPSWRSRPSRRRSASPASTIRARDARSASSRARSSTSSRAFSIASAAAAAASRSSSGDSHSAAS